MKCHYHLNVGAIRKRRGLTGLPTKARAFTSLEWVTAWADAGGGESIITASPIKCRSSRLSDDRRLSGNDTTTTASAKSERGNLAFGRRSSEGTRVSGAGDCYWMAYLWRDVLARLRSSMAGVEGKCPIRRDILVRSSVS